MTDTARPRPPKSCPICKVAMLARKSTESVLDFDMFACLRCGTTVEYSRGPADGVQKKS